MTAHTILTFTDPKTNANKFYEVTMSADGTVTASWGRIKDGERTSSQSQVKGSGQATFERLLASKRRRGYTEPPLATGSTGRQQASKAALAEAGRKQLAADQPQLSGLVDRLVSINQHDIFTASGGAVTVKDGEVTTALGALTHGGIIEARDLLVSMRDGSVTDHHLAQYLRLVPQKVPHKAGWGDTFFTEHTSFDAQLTFLDQLEKSIQFADTQAKATTPDDLFRYRLAEVTDAKKISEVRKAFNDSKNDKHASARATIVTVYELTDTSRADAIAAAQTKVGNIQRLWHGSRAANVLSILASGLTVPPSGARHTTGRMFGDGVYLSNQSTKSLNYSRGGVWSSGRDDRYFMFLADVAMGRPFRPGHNRSGISTARRSGNYDSVDVQPGTSGVRNHEAVVWNPDQIAMRYLVEFKDR